jgi:F420-0:gamma-glutamyl ligase-like protein
MIAQLFALVDESRVVKISDGVNDADATYRMLKEAFAALPDDDAAIHKRYGEEHALNCIHGFAI